MMYAIRVDYYATPLNKNFPNRHTIYYTGKGGALLNTEQIESPRFDEFNKLNLEALKRHGYARACDAMRALKYRQKLADDEMKYGFYTIECCVVNA